MSSTRRQIIQGAAAAFAALSAPAQEASTPGRLTLWYKQPATKWESEALPIGNGHLGAMVFGGVAHERLQLNEHSLWSGHPTIVDRPQTLEALPKVRQLLFEGKYSEAQAMAQRDMMGPNLGNFAAYQTLGDLLLDFEHGASDEPYRRSLDLDTGIARVEYKTGAVRHWREVFASWPDQAIVMRIAADQPGAVTFDLRLTREENATVTYDGSRVRMAGQARNEGVKFEAVVEVRAEGGSVSASPAGLTVKGADAVTIWVAAVTNYNNRTLKLTPRPWQAARDAHVAEHRRLLRRVDLDLGGPDRSHLPTDERLAAMQAGGDDPQLLATYFQFGRYLLLSSSRAGTLPANLQGLWAQGLNPPWQADYHVNINIQMNYWPAEVTNLSECHMPLFDFTEMLRAPGRRTAKIAYNCGGFVVHYTTTPWGQVALTGNTQYGLWHGGAGWLALHFWEHYLFTGDRQFLRDRA